MSESKQTWTLWNSSNGDVILTALDCTAYDGELVFKACGKVIARYSYAGQVKKDFSNSRSKARVTKKPQTKCDETGVELADDYRLVDNLMRMKELGYDFGEHEYGKHPYEAHGARALGYTRKAAWKLLNMLASGDSEGLTHLSKLIEMRKEILSTPPQRKELATIARAIEKAAAEEWRESGEIKPPTFADVIRIYSPTSNDEPTEIRRKMRDAGFGWLPKKWQRKT